MLRDMFDHVQFNLRLDTIEFRLLIPDRAIVVDSLVVPNFHFLI